MLLGGLLIAGTLMVAMAVVVGILFFVLIVNVFTVPFTGELRWYGPDLFDMVDPGLRNGMLAASAVGSVLLVVGGVRRYGAESPPPLPPPPGPPAWPPPAQPPPG